MILALFWSIGWTFLTLCDDMLIELVSEVFWDGIVKLMMLSIFHFEGELEDRWDCNCLLPSAWCLWQQFATITPVEHSGWDKRHRMSGHRRKWNSERGKFHAWNPAMQEVQQDSAMQGLQCQVLRKCARNATRSSVLVRSGFYNSNKGLRAGVYLVFARQVVNLVRMARQVVCLVQVVNIFLD